MKLVYLFLQMVKKHSIHLKQKENWDIYEFELYEEARPKEAAIISGDFKNDSGDELANTNIELTYLESGEAYQKLE